MARVEVKKKQIADVGLLHKNNYSHIFLSLNMSPQSLRMKLASFLHEYVEKGLATITVYLVTLLLMVNHIKRNKCCGKEEKHRDEDEEKLESYFCFILAGANVENTRCTLFWLRSAKGNSPL